MVCVVGQESAREVLLDLREHEASSSCFKALDGFGRQLLPVEWPPFNNHHLGVPIGRKNIKATITT